MVIGEWFSACKVVLDGQAFLNVYFSGQILQAASNITRKLLWEFSSWIARLGGYQRQ